MCLLPIKVAGTINAKQKTRLARRVCRNSTNIYFGVVFAPVVAGRAAAAPGREALGAAGVLAGAGTLDDAL